MGINHLAVIEQYSGSFTKAVAGNLGLPVPSCPGWTVDDLVAHMAEVQSWWTAVVLAKGAYPDEEAARLAADTGPDRVEGWREISARFVAVQEDYLRVAGPDAPVWVFWNEEKRDTALALASRQAHEVVVHCWDAQQAVGALEPIPAELAADGVDEFLLRFLNGKEWEGGPLVLELAATDTGATWLLGTDGSARPARLAEGTADVRVSGTAEQLYLLLWRRLVVEDVTVAGDRAKVDALLGWPKLA